MRATYVLPIKRAAAADQPDLPGYLERLCDIIDVIVVDGSAPDVFEALARSLPPKVKHVAVDRSIEALNGKVAGVLTALPLVRTPGMIIADDDVRYDEASLLRVTRLLEHADAVAPQNVFEPMPWHALLDTGRTLIARALGGDWPGTLAVRTAGLRAHGGYSGDVLFENLELARTIRAAGGRFRFAPDCCVVRRPPSAAHYLRQRVRQAYDEFARPGFLLAELALAPVLIGGTARWGTRFAAAAALCAVALAECGRRRARGAERFPIAAAFLAPFWVIERSITMWIALFVRLRGGVRYGNGILRVAAHSMRELRGQTA